ncbi:MAG: 50S ribosomal protein L11 methyltransferase [bacterium]
MVTDPRRTPALLRAVKAAVRPGDTVLDIGTGLGVLAIAAAKAGAQRVFACDVDRAALAEARQNAKREGFAGKIKFIRGLSHDISIPARADVILCETVGSFAFDENILTTLSDARIRLLAREGRIVPARLELWGALLERVPRLEMPAEIGRVSSRDLLSKPRMLDAIDFASSIPEWIHVQARFKIKHKGTVRALAVWPRAIWWGKELSDASPLLKPTHWKQGILPLEPRVVTRCDSADIELIIQPHPDDPHTMTERLWRWIE